MPHPYRGTPPQPPAPKRVLSVLEAAEQLGISRSHLYSMRAAGLIHFGKLLGRTVVAQHEVDRIVASMEGAGDE